jgi:hypothetical protein
MIERTLARWLSPRWVSEKVGTINNGIEAELLEWNRQRICIQFCAHHLFDGKNILTVHVSAARAFRFLRRDFV